MDDFARVAKKLRRLPEKIEDEMTEQAHDELRHVERTAARNLRKDGTWYKGDIADSMNVVPYTNGSYTGARLVTKANHAPYTEYGTGAYFGTGAYPLPSGVTPYDAPDGVTDDMVTNIEEWVIRKPVNPRYYSSTSDLANAIAHTIAAVGTQAHPYLRPAWYSRRQKLIDNMHDAASDVVDDEF